MSTTYLVVMVMTEKRNFHGNQCSLSIYPVQFALGLLTKKCCVNSRRSLQLFTFICHVKFVYSFNTLGLQIQHIQCTLIEIADRDIDRSQTQIIEMEYTRMATMATSVRVTRDGLGELSEYQHPNIPMHFWESNCVRKKLQELC